MGLLFFQQHMQALADLAVTQVSNHASGAGSSVGLGLFCFSISVAL